MSQVVAVDDQQRTYFGWHALFIIADTMKAAMQADVVLRGGSVVTFDPALPRATSVAVSGGRIVAVGDDLAELVGPSTRVVDTSGCAVIPGFVDAHIHFGQYALGRQQINLDGAATLHAGLAQIAAYAENNPAGWLRGRGWDRNRWGRLPTAAEIDAVVGDRPAVLSSHDGHSMWLSGAALRAVGITRQTEAPAGGVIERDERGEPSGVLLENAQDVARRRIPLPSRDELTEAIRQALRQAARAGLTGLHNLEDEHSLAAFKTLEERGELSLRVYHGVRRGQLRQAKELGYKTGAGSEWLGIGPVKLFSDGALGSRTAHLLEPYEGARDGYRGVPTMQPDELLDHMREASRVGLDVAVHAIGDAAVRTVLDAVERVRQLEPSASQRMFRIEHAQLVHPADVRRFVALGVVASMQPIHAIADWRAADQHWGDRARHGYAWRTLIDAGTLLAFGTDAPVERLEPLASLHAAVTRRDPDGLPKGGWYPEQRLGLQEAIRAYTLGSAKAERADNRRGAVKEGNDADLVVLRPDPFEREPDALRETTVALTMVGGRIVHEA